MDERRRSAAVVLRMLRTLVEDKLGGRVVGKSGDRWLSVADAERMLAEGRIGVDELAAIGWRIYLAADWLDRCRSAIEHHHEAARERGDVAYRVEITTDRAVAKAAEDNRGLALPASAATTTASLRECLLAARERRGLSQEAAAAIVGVSRPLWAAWETGRKPIPQKRAEALARWASEDIQDGQ